MRLAGHQAAAGSLPRLHCACAAAGSRPAWPRGRLATLGPEGHPTARSQHPVAEMPSVCAVGSGKALFWLV